MRARLGRAAVAATVVVAAACASSASRAGDVVSLVDPGTPGWRLEREEHLVLGRVTLALARAVVRMTDEEEAARILAGVRRVEVATYRVLRRGESTLGAFNQLATSLSAAGWASVVEINDGSQTTWVMQHARPDGRLDRLLVLELDGSSLEVVRLDGDMERVLAEALADDPDELVEAVRPSS